MKTTMRYLLEGAAALLLVSLIATMGALHFTRPPLSYTQSASSLERTVEARIVTVRKETLSAGADGDVIGMQSLEIEILSPGDLEGRHVEVEHNRAGAAARDVTFKEGQRILVMVNQRPDGQLHFAVADRVRWWALAALTGIFSLVTILTGRWQGVRALSGLLLSIFIIGGFILPQILADREPLLVALIGVATVMAFSLYLIQGWEPVTHIALLGLLTSLGITAIMAMLWTYVAHLTGFGSEETLYLQATGVTLNMHGVLLAGMIIGAAGVIDDVVLAQAITVFELARANQTLPPRELFLRGMKIGNAHLASMINTLVFAYASAALPLLILFFLYPEPWYLTLNRELIAEEIVRTVVGSLGLMLAVPLTTLIAAWVAQGVNVAPGNAPEQQSV
ncbi:MAG: YibE/F family protein [Anaerolineae bacterium]|nr:YibE/F family protein [Anaerolineae bacterium]